MVELEDGYGDDVTLGNSFGKRVNASLFVQDLSLVLLLLLLFGS